MRNLREELKAKMAVTLAELRNMQQLEDAVQQAEVQLMSAEALTHLAYVALVSQGAWSFCRDTIKTLLATSCGFDSQSRIMFVNVSRPASGCQPKAILYAGNVARGCTGLRKVQRLCANLNNRGRSDCRCSLPQHFVQCVPDSVP